MKCLKDTIYSKVPKSYEENYEALLKDIKENLIVMSYSLTIRLNIIKV